MARPSPDQLALYQRVIDDYYAGKDSAKMLGAKYGLRRGHVQGLVSGRRCPGLRRPARADEKRRDLHRRWKSESVRAWHNANGRDGVSVCRLCEGEFTRNNAGQTHCSRACEGLSRRIDPVPIRTLWGNGLGDLAIGLELGLHRMTVRKVRERLGLRSNAHFRRTGEIAPELVRLHAEGQSDPQIATALGYGRGGAIAYHRRRLGLLPNNQWDWPGRREKQARVLLAAIFPGRLALLDDPERVSDTDLIALIDKCAPPDAIAEVWRRYEPLARKEAMRRKLPLDIIDEVVSRAMESVFRAELKVRPGRYAPGPWSHFAVGTAATAVGKQATGYNPRTKKNRVVREADAGVNDDGESTLDMGRAEAAESAEMELVDALSAVPEQDAQIIRWMHLDGLSLREIGDRLGMHHNAVKDAADRAMAALQAAHAEGG